MTAQKSTRRLLTQIGASFLGVFVAVLTARLFFPPLGALGRPPSSATLAGTEKTLGGGLRNVPNLTGHAPGEVAVPETVVGRPGYDPQKLMAVVPTADLFAQEPRDESWAPQVETWLQTAMATDFAPLASIKNVTTECKSTVCKVSWRTEGPKNRVEREALVRMLSVLYGSSGGGGGKQPNELILVYGNGSQGETPKGDAKALIAIIEQRRQGFLEQAKRAIAHEGKFLQVAANFWPER